MTCPFAAQIGLVGSGDFEHFPAWRLRLAGRGKSKPTKARSKKSLYDRLGGIFAIAAVVDHFSDAILRNPRIGVGSPNPYLDNWSRNEAPTRLAGLKWMRTLWLASLAGGPFQYHSSESKRKGKCPFSLENAHKQLQIAPADFDEVARELARTLDHFGVQDPEKTQVLQAFASHKPDVNHGFFTARRRRAPPFHC